MSTTLEPHPGESAAEALVAETPINNFGAVDSLRDVDFEQARAKSAFRTPLLERVIALIGIDALAILVASKISFLVWAWLATGSVDETLGQLVASRWYWLPMATLAWLGASWMTDLYDAATSGLNGLRAQRTLMAMAITTVAFLAGYFFFPADVPRVFFLLFTVLVGTLSFAGRTMFESWSEKNAIAHRMLLVGDGASARELRSLFGRVERMKFELAGWTDEHELARLHFDHGVDGLCRYAVSQGVNEVIFSGSTDSENDDVYRSLVECQANGIRVSSMANVYRMLSRQIPIEFVDSQWVLSAMQDRVFFTRFQMAIKRAFDVVGAVAALPILAVVFPFVALAIKMDTPGPIFYLQERTGRAGRKFRIIKFRTMGTDAEKDGKAVWAQNNDPRITRVGAFLRKTRIDELPQFINVLLGEMSLVGPRPEREQIEQKLDVELPHYFIRRLVKPGITGWAQVHYKYGNTLQDSLKKLQYDAYYVRHWTVMMDVYVVLRTFGVMIGSKGQ